MCSDACVWWPNAQLWQERARRSYAVRGGICARTVRNRKPGRARPPLSLSLSQTDRWLHTLYIYIQFLSTKTIGQHEAASSSVMFAPDQFLQQLALESGNALQISRTELNRTLYCKYCKS